MVYNLRSIGQSLMLNTDLNNVDLYVSPESSDTGVSASSLNNPSSARHKQLPNPSTTRQKQLPNPSTARHKKLPNPSTARQKQLPKSSTAQQKQLSHPQSKVKPVQQAKNTNSYSLRSQSGHNTITPKKLMVNPSNGDGSFVSELKRTVDDNNNNDVGLSYDLSNNSCSKMTTSDTCANISHESSSDHQTYRKSASLACLESSSLNTKDGNVATGLSTETKESLVCSVLNCSAHFSSTQVLQEHCTLFKHSPCNPVLLNKNARIASTPICYICPKCDREFQQPKDCTEHMISTNHFPFYPPLAVTAYMCAQCLNLFDSFETCWKHLEEMSHHAVTYAFKDDQTGTINNGGPVAVVRELVEDFIRRCNKVPYNMQCLECGLHIESARKLQLHNLETNNQHTVASFTETTVLDVFANYLATYVCNLCHRLFSGELKELAKHQCSKKSMGTIVDNDTASFSEFVKRCALTLIKSLEVDPTNVPGTSRCSRRMRRALYMENKEEDNSDVELDFERSVMNRERSNSGNDSVEFVSESDRNSLKIVDQCLERPKSKKNGDSFRGKKSAENLNDTEKSENVKLIILDDSDASDDIESNINGGSKRKRKQKMSDRNKQLACDAQSESQSKFISLEPVCSPVVIDISDDSSPAKYSLRDRVSAQRANTSAAQGTSRAETSQPAKYDQKMENQSVYSKPELSKKNERKIIRDVIEIDSDTDIIENKKTENTTEFTHPKPGPSLAQPSSISSSGAHTVPIPGPTRQVLVNRVAPRLVTNQPLLSAASFNNPFAAFNFTPHSTQIPPSILTMGNLRPAFVAPNTAMHYLGNSLAYSTPQTQNIVQRPSRYFLRNSTTYSRQLSPNASSYQPCTSQNTQPSSTLSNIASVNRPIRWPSQNIPSSQPQNAPSTSHNKTTELISTENLTRMKNIIFLDLDNWPSFFDKLPTSLPDLTFVWGFFGGRKQWYEPYGLPLFREMRQRGMFYLNKQCGFTKDAADFAIVLTVGKMNERLPSDIAFTILSGDKGFIEVERLMSESKRKVLVVNPHSAAQFSNDMIYALLTSITDS